MLEARELGKGIYALMAYTPPKDNNGVSSVKEVRSWWMSESMARQVQDIIHRLTDKPIRYLVNTTYHSDHTFGNYAFPQDTTIICSTKNKESMRDLEADKQIHSGNLRGNVAAIANITMWSRPEIIFDPYLAGDLCRQAVQLCYFGPGNAPTVRNWSK